MWEAFGVELGKVGIWTSYRTIGEENAGEAAALAEALGFGTFWLGGSPALPDTRPLLAATTRLTVAPGIVNVWMHEPASVAAEHAALTREFPDRLLLGIGVGHPEATGEYATPLTVMGAFLDGLDHAAAPVPRAERAIAALGPRMLDLCAERTRGTLTYFCPVAHTRFARERVGPAATIAAELACVLDTDEGRARASARAFARGYLARRNYTENLRRFGFTDADIANGGSDRLIDAIVPHGSAEHVAAVAREHLEAGADHVCVQPVGVSGIPREEWSALAGALVG
jgi:probable F420-dependent oxidoreductase